VTHIPGAINENPIYKQIQLIEQMIGQVYEHTITSLVVCGPPGIGKTTEGEKVAKAHGQPWTPQRPGTAIGLLHVLRAFRDASVVAFDDTDGKLWDDPDSLDLLKHALDSKDKRIISHTVGSKVHTFLPFEFKAGVIFFSNRDFYNPKAFRKTDITAVTDRCAVVGLTFDPLSIYEYTGWLATSGGMLRDVGRNTPKGRVYLSRNGANDVLDHFAENAPRYPNLGPRALHKAALLRLGVADPGAWRALMDAQLLPGDKARWKELPPDLFRYQIAAPADRKTKPVAAVSAATKPVEEAPAAPVTSAIQVKNVVDRIKSRCAAGGVAVAAEGCVEVRVATMDPPVAETPSVEPQKRGRGRPPKPPPGPDDRLRIMGNEAGGWFVVRASPGPWSGQWRANEIAVSNVYPTRAEAEKAARRQSKLKGLPLAG
jgi:hypothetical protein